MSQPILAPLTHCSQPADSWYARHSDMDSLLKKRKSDRSNQDQGLQEMISRQNTQAIYAHAQSAKNISEHIRQQLISLKSSDDNVEAVSMSLESLERRVNLIVRICEDDKDIRELRDLEKKYGEMADEKIATMMSGRPTSPPPSFPQPQPKDGVAETEASASEQEQGGSDATSVGDQKDGEAGFSDADSVQECALYGREYHMLTSTLVPATRDDGLILVSPESVTYL